MTFEIMDISITAQKPKGFHINGREQTTVYEKPCYQMVRWHYVPGRASRAAQCLRASATLRVIVAYAFKYPELHKHCSIIYVKEYLEPGIPDVIYEYDCEGNRKTT
jgi:hypothetical protein